MDYPRGKWIVTFLLTPECECTRATVHIVDDPAPREVFVMHPGPFDSPEDLLGTFIELIDQAEWHGEQLRLPVSSAD